ncbi:MAG: toll/interleukin-1 receptor domain-containing protein [Rhodospirillales bacterium]|nr:toll/interleukin-1 receptor domain-containing protein [Rhodospirillales bacterium]
MANEQHLAQLRAGVDAWNDWREQHPRQILPNLNGANLNGADLSCALLVEADLREAKLVGADLHRAHLSGARLQRAKLDGADLRQAWLYETVFVNVDLSATQGLEACIHRGPSVIDHRTLQQSGRLPLAFLRGCGLPDRLIDYLPSLLDQAIQYYSCFISYSSKDDAFAKRLHADLQNSGVRCWFAPHDLPIGAKTWDAIDAAIRVRDKVLLILSENAIASDWVEDEVSKAFAEEKRRGQVVLFPVRIDEEVKTTSEPWAVKLSDQRHIGDFRKWKDHDAYQQAFERVLRDLKQTPR